MMNSLEISIAFHLISGDQVNCLWIKFPHHARICFFPSQKAWIRAIWLKWFLRKAMKTHRNWEINRLKESYSKKKENEQETEWKKEIEKTEWKKEIEKNNRERPRISFGANVSLKFEWLNHLFADCGRLAFIARRI